MLTKSMHQIARTEFRNAKFPTQGGCPLATPTSGSSPGTPSSVNDLPPSPFQRLNPPVLKYQSINYYIIKLSLYRCVCTSIRAFEEFQIRDRRETGVVLLVLLLMEIHIIKIKVGAEKKYAKAYQATVKTTCHYFGKTQRSIIFPRSLTRALRICSYLED